MELHARQFVSTEGTKMGYGLTVCMAMALAIFGAAPGLAEPTAPCRQPSHNRALLIGKTLHLSRLMLSQPRDGEAYPLETVDPFGMAAPRFVLHRTFILTTESGAGVDLFYTRRGRVVIEQGMGKPRPIPVPVFFVGRPQGAHNDLILRAQRLEFAPSAVVEKGQTFSKVAFRVHRGASLFSEVRPFFKCGLPAVLVCEDYCPDVGFRVGMLLVEAVLAKQTKVVQIPPPPPKKESIWERFDTYLRRREIYIYPPEEYPPERESPNGAPPKDAPPQSEANGR